MQVHGPSGTFERPGVHLNTQIPGEPFVIVQHAGVLVTAETTAECDVMIAAWTEARRLLAEAQTDHAIAADLDEQTATRVPLDVVGDDEQLYVVVNVEPDGRRVTVSDPRPKALAEQWVQHEAQFYAGTLEVAPARPEDLDDADGNQ